MSLEPAYYYTFEAVAKDETVFVNEHGTPLRISSATQWVGIPSEAGKEADKRSEKSGLTVCERILGPFIPENQEKLF